MTNVVSQHLPSCVRSRWKKIKKNQSMACSERSKHISKVSWNFVNMFKVILMSLKSLNEGCNCDELKNMFLKTPLPIIEDYHWYHLYTLRGASHMTYFYFKLSHYIMVKIVIRIIYLIFIVKSAIPFLFLVFWVEPLFCLWNNLLKCVVVNKTFFKLLRLITNICMVTQTNIF